MRSVKNLEILITAEELAAKVTELAREIDRDYAGKDTVFLGILKGSCVFMADLARKVHLDRLEMNFMMVSSYENATSSSGNINIKLDLENDITGKHVLIVEDIGQREDLHHAQQALPPENKSGAGLLRLHHPQCVRGGLRAGLRPAVPAAAGCVRSAFRG